MKTNLSEHEYKAFVTEIKTKGYQSQHQAMRQVNRELISLYWEIGRSIVERQEKYGWGKSIVANLSRDLQNEFPGVNDFLSRTFGSCGNFTSDMREMKFSYGV